MSHRLGTPVPLAMLNDAAGAQAREPKLPRMSWQRQLTDLLPRAVSSIVLMAAALVSVWQGGTIFVVIWLVAAGAVGYEWQHLIGGARQVSRILLAGLAVVLAAQITGKDGIGPACAVLTLVGTLAALLAGEGRRLWAFAGIAYAGALIVAVSALYGSEDFGVLAIVWLFATVWGTDVFAYFGGRLIGGPKLWPRISPSKTWSGTFVGLFAGAVLGAMIGAVGQFDLSSAPPIFCLGLVTSMVAQAGDIFESCVKRHFGVKDSSILIPGHGGFMDRLDGFIAAASFVTLVGVWRDLPSIADGLFVWF